MRTEYKQKQTAKSPYIFVILTALLLVIAALQAYFSGAQGVTDPSPMTADPPITNDAPPKFAGDGNLYFPHTEMGREQDANTSDWRLLLVNPWNLLPENFSVELFHLSSGHAVDKRIYSDLQAMLDAAQAEGLSPIICSSYRTWETQQHLFNSKVEQYLAQGYPRQDAEEEAGKWVAVPGTSEHQTGLAIDIVALDYQLLDEQQEETPEQKWLMEHSYKYGFILRYPAHKSHITGIHYEPWHYRYVGKELATELYQKGLCLEEYLEGQH